MRQILHIAILFFAFSPLHSAAETSPIYTKVTAEQILEMQKMQSGLVVIDVRSEQQAATGMIKGAINLPVYHFNNEALAQHIPAKDTPIILYCNDLTCGASALAASKAYKMGYINLYKYPQGIADWMDKGLPTNQ